MGATVYRRAFFMVLCLFVSFFVVVLFCSLMDTFYFTFLFHLFLFLFFCLFLFSLVFFPLLMVSELGTKDQMSFLRVPCIGFAVDLLCTYTYTYIYIYIPHLK